MDMGDFNLMEAGKVSCGTTEIKKNYRKKALCCTPEMEEAEEKAGLIFLNEN